jgi:predicted DNA binding CopG/RHH family protein
MRKPSSSAKPAKRTIPRFRTEAEEARWWDKQGSRIARDVEEAVHAGQDVSTVPPALARAAAASRNITIRLPLDDLEKARRLAQRRGLRYQTYVKMLLHQALDADDKHLV